MVVAYLRGLLNLDSNSVIGDVDLDIGLVLEDVKKLVMEPVRELHVSQFAEIDDGVVFGNGITLDRSRRRHRFQLWFDLVSIVGCS